MKQRGRQEKCRKGCCWTPQDVCARRELCACHRAGVEYQTRADQRKKQAAMRHAETLFARADEDRQIVERETEQEEWTQ